MSRQTICAEKNIAYYFFKACTRHIIKRILNPANKLSRQRRLLRFLSSRLIVPEDISIKPFHAGALQGKWIVPANARKNTALLFLHGGGFIVGSMNLYRGLIIQLAQATASPVVFPDYRLAPEYGFPAALEDCISAYSSLIDAGFPPENIIVCGDSAGGNLALVLGLLAQARGLPKPACLVCFSPLTDLTLSGDSIRDSVISDPMLDITWLKTAIKHYAGGHDCKDFRLSPLFGELGGLPPTLIQIGSKEILLSDATRLETLACSLGGRVELEIWESMWHAWHIYAAYLPQARDAVKRAAIFIKQNTCSDQIGIKLPGLGVDI